MARGQVVRLALTRPASCGGDATIPSMGLFGLFKPESSSSGNPPVVRIGGTTEWRDIVHMRDHAADILAILKQRGRRSDDDPQEIAASGTVMLVRDPRPSGDAVAVVFEGRHVGDLSKADATKIAPALARQIPEGHVAVTGARICNHLNPHPERLKAGSSYVLEAAVPEFSGVVTVAPPDQWFPSNNPPPGAFHTFEVTSSGALVDTAEHKEFLSYLLTAGQSPYFWATLHPSATPRGRIYVDVMVDGRPVGRLGPTLTKQSGERLTVLACSGRAVAAYFHPTRAKGGLGGYISTPS